MGGYRSYADESVDDYVCIDREGQFTPWRRRLRGCLSKNKQCFLSHLPHTQSSDDRKLPESLDAVYDRVPPYIHTRTKEIWARWDAQSRSHARRPERPFASAGIRNDGHWLSRYSQPAREVRWRAARIEL